MFSVTSAALNEIRSGLEPFANELVSVWTRFPSLESRVTEQGQRPFVQLSAHELSDEDEEAIFNYAGIPMAAAPIGLPVTIEPTKLGDDPKTQRLLFPLDGFYAHISRTAPTAVEAYERAGSLDSFLERGGSAVTAKEYLVASLAEAIRFCRANNEALVIRW